MPIIIKNGIVILKIEQRQHPDPTNQVIGEEGLNYYVRAEGEISQNCCSVSLEQISSSSFIGTDRNFLAGERTYKGNDSIGCGEKPLLC